jgi:mannose-6-phosphate isomerase-like protein (cupin superfamily)
MILTKPVFVEANGGKTMTVLGASYTVKVSGAETRGSYSLVETVAPAQSAVPPHIHRKEQETFYILEGTMEMQCDGKTFVATKGATVMLPQNVPHSYRNPGDVPAKFLVLLEPSGFEGFFEEAGQLPADQPPDLAKIAAIGKKYGLELLPLGEK